MCNNSGGSFTCSCNEGYTLEDDGHSCKCGGTLTAASGSFQTPGWPNGYPQENFQCEWIIELPNTNRVIQFTIDASAYGINGWPPCIRDHMQFFDGTDDNDVSIHKLCGMVSPAAFSNSLSRARVVFAGFVNPLRPLDRVGVKVDYTSITLQGICT